MPRELRKSLGENSKENFERLQKDLSILSSNSNESAESNNDKNWWKYMSGYVTRRKSILLKNNETLLKQNSSNDSNSSNFSYDWWKNLSNNNSIQFTKPVNVSSENERFSEREEINNEVKQKNIFRKKRLPRRYSKAFDKTDQSKIETSVGDNTFLCDLNVTDESLNKKTKLHEKLFGRKSRRHKFSLAFDNSNNSQNTLNSIEENLNDVSPENIKKQNVVDKNFSGDLNFSDEILNKSVKNVKCNKLFERKSGKRKFSRAFNNTDNSQTTLNSVEENFNEVSLENVEKQNVKDMSFSSNLSKILYKSIENNKYHNNLFRRKSEKRKYSQAFDTSDHSSVSSIDVIKNQSLLDQISETVWDTSKDHSDRKKLISYDENLIVQNVTENKAIETLQNISVNETVAKNSSTHVKIKNDQNIQTVDDTYDKNPSFKQSQTIETPKTIFGDKNERNRSFKQIKTIETPEAVFENEISDKNESAGESQRFERENYQYTPTLDDNNVKDQNIQDVTIATPKNINKSATKKDSTRKSRKFTSEPNLNTLILDDKDKTDQNYENLSATKNESTRNSKRLELKNASADKNESTRKSKLYERDDDENEKNKNTTIETPDAVSINATSNKNESSRKSKRLERENDQNTPILDDKYEKDQNFEQNEIVKTPKVKSARKSKRLEKDDEKITPTISKNEKNQNKTIETPDAVSINATSDKKESTRKSKRLERENDQNTPTLDGKYEKDQNFEQNEIVKTPKVKSARKSKRLEKDDEKITLTISKNEKNQNKTIETPDAVSINATSDKKESTRKSKRLERENDQNTPTLDGKYEKDQNFEQNEIVKTPKVKSARKSKRLEKDDEKITPTINKKEKNQNKTIETLDTVTKNATSDKNESTRKSKRLERKNDQNTPTLDDKYEQETVKTPKQNSSRKSKRLEKEDYKNTPTVDKNEKNQNKTIVTPDTAYKNETTDKNMSTRKSNRLERKYDQTTPTLDYNNMKDQNVGVETIRTQKNINKSATRQNSTRKSKSLKTDQNSLIFDDKDVEDKVEENFKNTSENLTAAKNKSTPNSKHFEMKSDLKTPILDDTNTVEQNFKQDKSVETLKFVSKSTSTNRNKSTRQSKLIVRENKQNSSTLDDENKIDQSLEKYKKIETSKPESKRKSKHLERENEQNSPGLEDINNKYCVEQNEAVGTPKILSKRATAYKNETEKKSKRIERENKPSLDDKHGNGQNFEHETVKTLKEISTRKSKCLEIDDDENIPIVNKNATSDKNESTRKSKRLERENDQNTPTLDDKYEKDQNFEQNEIVKTPKVKSARKSKRLEKDDEKITPTVDKNEKNQNKTIEAPDAVSINATSNKNESSRKSKRLERENDQNTPILDDKYEKDQNFEQNEIVKTPKVKSARKSKRLEKDDEKITAIVDKNQKNQNKTIETPDAVSINATSDKNESTRKSKRLERENDQNTPTLDGKYEKDQNFEQNEIVKTPKVKSARKSKRLEKYDEKITPTVDKNEKNQNNTIETPDAVSINATSDKNESTRKSKRLERENDQNTPTLDDKYEKDQNIEQQETVKTPKQNSTRKSKRLETEDYKNTPTVDKNEKNQNKTIETPDAISKNTTSDKNESKRLKRDNDQNTLTLDNSNVKGRNIEHDKSVATPKNINKSLTRKETNLKTPILNDKNVDNHKSIINSEDIKTKSKIVEEENLQKEYETSEPEGNTTKNLMPKTLFNKQKEQNRNYSKAFATSEHINLTTEIESSKNSNTMIDVTKTNLEIDQTLSQSSKTLFNKENKKKRNYSKAFELSKNINMSIEGVQYLESSLENSQESRRNLKSTPQKYKYKSKIDDDNIETPPRKSKILNASVTKSKVINDEKVDTNKSVTVDSTKKHSKLIESSKSLGKAIVQTSTRKENEIKSSNKSKITNDNNSVINTSKSKNSRESLLSNLAESHTNNETSNIRRLRSSQSLKRKLFAKDENIASVDDDQIIANEASPKNIFKQRKSILKSPYRKVVNEVKSVAFSKFSRISQPDCNAAIAGTDYNETDIQQTSKNSSKLSNIESINDSRKVKLLFSNKLKKQKTSEKISPRKFNSISQQEQDATIAAPDHNETNTQQTSKNSLKLSTIESINDSRKEKLLLFGDKIKKRTPKIISPKKVSPRKINSISQQDQDAATAATDYIDTKTQTSDDSLKLSTIESINDTSNEKLHLFSDKLKKQKTPEKNIRRKFNAISQQEQDATTAATDHNEIEKIDSRKSIFSTSDWSEKSLIASTKINITAPDSSEIKNKPKSRQSKVSLSPQLSKENNKTSDSKLIHEFSKNSESQEKTPQKNNKTRNTIIKSEPVSEKTSSFAKEISSERSSKSSISKNNRINAENEESSDETSSSNIIDISDEGEEIIPKETNSKSSKKLNFNIRHDILTKFLNQDLSEVSEFEDEITKKLPTKAKQISKGKQSKTDAITKEKSQIKVQPISKAKQMTDYFRTVGKKEYEEIIKKKLNIDKKIVKKTSITKKNKPVKLFQGKYWCTKYLYKYLQNQMKEIYEEDELIDRSVNLMKFMAESVQIVIKTKKKYDREVMILKKELARNNIVKTNYDFFCFVSDFLPYEYISKVVPCTQANTDVPTVPYNEETLHCEININ